MWMARKRVGRITEIFIGIMWKGIVEKDYKGQKVKPICFEDRVRSQSLQQPCLRYQAAIRSPLKIACILATAMKMWYCEMFRRDLCSVRCSVRFLHFCRTTHSMSACVLRGTREPKGLVLKFWKNRKNKWSYWSCRGRQEPCCMV